MASVDDVRIAETDKGIRVDLGKLYMYPDGHANLTFPDAVVNGQSKDINLPLSNPADVIAELVNLVRRMQDQVVRTRPAPPTSKA